MKHTFLIKSVDEAKREVGGLLTSDALDKDNEILDYEGSKPHFQAWAQEAYDATTKAGQDPSYGNLRVQHNAKLPVGKFVQPLTFDDAAQTIWGLARIVDDDTWDKVKQGVFTGFSIGGSLAAPVKKVGDKKMYTIKPLECSLVDNPSNPDSHFDFIRAVDGQVIKMPFVQNQQDRLEKLESSIAELLEVIKTTLEKRAFSDKEREHLAESGAALPDGSYPIESEQDLKNAIHAVGRAKDYDKAKAHIIARAKDLGKEDLLPDEWKTEKNKLPESTVGAIDTMSKAKELEIKKAARKSLHDHLTELKAAATAHKEAAEKHEAKVHDLVDKCMKLAGSDESDGDSDEAFESGKETAGGQKVDIGDESAATAEVKSVKADIEKLSSVVSNLVDIVKASASAKEKTVVGNVKEAVETGTKVKTADAKKQEADELKDLRERALGFRIVKAADGSERRVKLQHDPKAVDELYYKLTNAREYIAAKANR